MWSATVTHLLFCKCQYHSNGFQLSGCHCGGFQLFGVALILPFVIRTLFWLFLFFFITLHLYLLQFRWRIMLLSGPGFFITVSLAAMEGVVAHPYYVTKRCDPLTSGKIKNAYQVRNSLHHILLCNFVLLLAKTPPNFVELTIGKLKL